MYSKPYQLILGDCLEQMAKLPAGSVDMVLTDLPRKRQTTPDLPAKSVIRLYTEDRWTLRRIADHFATNHHHIRRVLDAHSVTITGNREKKPISNETRQKMSVAARRRGPRLVKTACTEEQNRANQRRKLQTLLDLAAYEDFERLKFLTRMRSRYRKQLGSTDADLKAFIDKFWDDPAFNALYERWIASGKNKWWMPSLDHKHPRSRDGGWELSNLHMLSWFENKAKEAMTLEEWQDFKRINRTTSDFFIENVLNDRIQPHGEQHREDSGLSTPLRRCA